MNGHLINIIRWLIFFKLSIISDLNWEQSPVKVQRTGSLLPRRALWRCSCWWSHEARWRNAEESAVCVYSRTLLESSHGTVSRQGGPLWRRPEHTGCCFPCSVATKKRQNQDLRKRNISFICPTVRKSERMFIFNSPNEMQISSFQDMSVNQVLHFMSLLVHCLVLLLRKAVYFLVVLFPLLAELNKKTLMTGWEEPMNFRRGSK